MAEFFPNGVWTYITGGALIGVGVAFIFVVTGVRAGASGVLTAALGYLSASPFIQSFRSERAWRLAFSAGLVVGGCAVALSWTAVTSEAAGFEPTGVDVWRLAVGGFLVGMGTRFARGCTSGHGICGLSSLNRSSLIHVIVFMGVAIVVARWIGPLL